ncbi:MAG: glycosyltransferase family 2 protein [Acidobacteriota bacterium]
MIDIIIATLKHPHLADCLEALFSHTRVPFNLHLIEEGHNFAEAVNIGLRASGAANDVILLDDDAVVLPGWLENLDDLLDQGDLLGCRYLYDDEQIIWEAGIEFCLHPKEGPSLRMTGDGLIADSCPDSGAHLHPVVNTVALYIKREVLEDVGLLNEDDYRYGYYYEDWDYALRATHRGYRAVTTPWRVRHPGASTKKHSPEFLFRRQINWHIFRQIWFQDQTFLAQMGERFPACESSYDLSPQLARKLESKRLAIYGAGSLFHVLYPRYQAQTVAVVDADASRWGEETGSHQIQSPALLSAVDFDLLLVTPFGRSDEIHSHLSTLLSREELEKAIYLAYKLESAQRGPSPSALFREKELQRYLVCQYLPPHHLYS